MMCHSIKTALTGAACRRPRHSSLEAAPGYYSRRYILQLNIAKPGVELQHERKLRLQLIWEKLGYIRLDGSTAEISDMSMRISCPRKLKAKVEKP
jgi:hypothetical protein